METNLQVIEVNISDLHKDVTGRRPSDWFWAEWEKKTSEEKIAEYNRLVDLL